jgi:hypothetical protein
MCDMDHREFAMRSSGSLRSSWPIKNSQTSVGFRQYAEASNMFPPCKDYNLI